MREVRIASPFPERNLLRRVQVNLPFPMLKEQLEAVLSSGLQPEVYFSGYVLDRLSSRDTERISRALEDKQVPVTFHAPFMDLNPGAVDERIREITALRFGQVLDLVPLFRPRAIILHPGYDRWRYDDDVDLWLENSLRTWEPLVKRAESLSVRMALENVFEEKPAILEKLLDKIDSPYLGYCLDAGHGNLFSRVPLEEWVEVLGSRLMEIHLHDNRGEADDHLPLGQGSIDFPSLFSLLGKKKIQPIYTIEPHEIAHLQPSLEALKKYLG
ncbi:MAG: sugar phosphate isomerase/epimerase [Syntrophaceae bacterium]|nr:sugar phosphate isomerase/epimerase [Syntrophaceae bacterium]